jgi:hypothetical protein
VHSLNEGAFALERPDLHVGVLQLPVPHVPRRPGARHAAAGLNGSVARGALGRAAACLAEAPEACGVGVEALADSGGGAEHARVVVDVVAHQALEVQVGGQVGKQKEGVPAPPHTGQHTLGVRNTVALACWGRPFGGRTPVREEGPRGLALGQPHVGPHVHPRFTRRAQPVHGPRAPPRRHEIGARVAVVRGVGHLCRKGDESSREPNRRLTR